MVATHHQESDLPALFDFIIIGSGVSGSFIAHELVKKGAQVLLLEAGKFFDKHTYPRTELEGNAQLYWSGGIEFNKSVSLGFLRPKVVGGGSIVNQALLDKFDEIALDDWRADSQVDFFSPEKMAPYYDRAKSELSIQEIPSAARNNNARIFEMGFQKNGFICAPLERAQKDCQYQAGNDCIECLNGCRLDSKQSTPVTVLRKAMQGNLAGKLHLISEFEVLKLEDYHGDKRVWGLSALKHPHSFQSKKIILASGSIGNTKILSLSGMNEKIPTLGHNFYTHPQYMVLARYEEKINAHLGPLQSMKSADPNFRRKGFKLENVFAGPVAISMLLRSRGQLHQKIMAQINHLACIEAAVRDTNPGKITVSSKGKVSVEKELNTEDKLRRDQGLKAIDDIFNSTGAKEILPGALPIGLHLMGGLGIGTNGAQSVVGPDFELHNWKGVYAADSSIFPNAPGINPSLTIMALGLKCAETLA